MKTDFNENLTNEDIEFREVLRDLKTTKVPADFGFRVKAKIAGSRESKAKFGAFSFLKVAVPMALILLVGIVVFNRLQVLPKENNVVASIPTVENMESPVSVTAKTSEPEILKTPVSVEPEIKPERNSVRNISDTTVAKVNLPNSDPRVRKGKVSSPIAEDERIFEKNSASTIQRNPTQPKGFETKPVENLESVNRNQSEINIKDALNELGIEAEDSNDKWIVKSVKKSSVADRSGVKANDIVESFDDQKLIPKESKVKSFSGKTLTVTREGKALEVKLIP